MTRTATAAAPELTQSDVPPAPPVTDPAPPVTDPAPPATDPAAPATDPEPGAAAPAAERQPSLIRLAVKASAWTVLGYGTGQVLRFGSNLVLTRLLFPEAFGMMALVNVFMQGLQMFSDLGIGPSIIQHRRGEEPAFYNTAWTVQVIRGGLLWACSCLLAWPAAAIYGEPMLLRLIPVAGLTALIAGFNSTALFMLNRRLALGKLVPIDLVSQVTSIGTMVAVALLTRSVWALLVSGLVYTTVKMALSHAVFREVCNRFHWEPEAGRSLIRFGRWIFIASALTFLAYQGDRLVMGGFFSMAQLGVYTTALFMSQAGLDLMQELSGKILFPLYSRFAHETDGSLARKMRRARIVLLAISLPGFCVLAVWGHEIIALLYDSRYWEAGWILRVLALGAIFRAISLTVMPAILACGDSFRHMVLMGTRSALLVTAMAVGGWLGGMRGLVIGVALTDLLNYPILAWTARRHRVWMPRLDIAALGYAGAVAAVCVAVFHVLH